MIYIPQPNTIRRKILDLIFGAGPTTRLQLREHFKNSTTAMNEALEFLTLKGSIEERDGYVHLSRPTYKFLMSFGEQPDNYVGKVAAPRTFTVNRPLTTMPTDVHKGRYRDDVEFKNGSSSFSNGVR